MKTTFDLKEALKQEDEISVLELLDISSEDLVERFQDFIEKRQVYLRKYLDPDFNPFDDDDYPDDEGEDVYSDDDDDEEDEWN